MTIIFKLLKIVVAILATAVLTVSLWILSADISCCSRIAADDDDCSELINKIRDPYRISASRMRRYLEGLKELSKKVKEAADPPSLESE